jgi:hypothetical protein
MQIVTVQLTDRNAHKALQDLEQKHVIRIVSSPRFESPALPGVPMELSAFQEWIADAEEVRSVRLNPPNPNGPAKEESFAGHNTRELFNVQIVF